MLAHVFTVGGIDSLAVKGQYLYLFSVNGLFEFGMDCQTKMENLSVRLFLSTLALF